MLMRFSFLLSIGLYQLLKQHKNGIRKRKRKKEKEDTKDEGERKKDENVFTNLIYCKLLIQTFYSFE